MSLFSVPKQFVCCALLALPLTGCFQVGEAPVEEEKDPYYLSGRNRLNSMDYDGAITSFERALTANPKSASAHLELGLLYEEKKGDFAAAIYHYVRHLDLRPDSNMAETIRQRIFSCKLELAKTVSFALVSRQVQDEIRRLYATNSALHEQIEQLKAQLAEQASAFSNKLASASQPVTPPSQTPSAPSPEPERRTAPAPSDKLAAAASRSSPRVASTPRVHVVKQGETLAAISKKYSVKLSSLQMVNPTVDARRLKAGQTLVLPTARN